MQPKNHLGRLLALAALALLATSCAGGGGRKEAQTYWKNLTYEQGVQAKLGWFSEDRKGEGTLSFFKPGFLRVFMAQEGELVLGQTTLCLVRLPWKSAVEIRAMPILDEQIVLGLLGRVISYNKKNYLIESAEGPKVAEIATRQLTLKPNPKGAATTGLPDLIERYWVDASGFPLRYALLQGDKEVYGWEVAKITDPKPPGGGMYFKYFPVTDNYRLSLSLPKKPDLKSNVEVLPTAEDAVEEFLQHPLYHLGLPLQERVLTFTQNRPLLDYSDFKKGYFAYLIQAPVVSPEQADAELKAKDDGWKEPRRQRLKAGHDFGPDNIGFFKIPMGERTIGYDNFFGIKAFGWIEDGQAMTIVTNLDLREALQAIAGGGF